MERTTNIVAIPGFAKERLSKAGGHINATERKLWHHTDRGLWSARQAKGQLAEAWLWLEDGTEFPPVERYLARDVVQARLEAFEKAPMSDALKVAWTKVTEAEQAIRKVGFPALHPKMTNAEREALNAGLARKYRYLDALRDLERCVRDAIAERFVDLRPGDWIQVRVRGRPTGRVLGLEGLTVSLFEFDVKSEDEDWLNYDISVDWENRILLYSLVYAEITRIQPPEHPPITEPSYYWMLSGIGRLHKLSYLIRKADWVVLADVDNILRKTLDAAAKAWWAAFAPRSRSVIWGSHLEQHVENLEPHAPSAVSDPLNRCLRRLRALTEERIAALPGEPANWRLTIEEMLPLAEEGLTALEPHLAPRIDLVTGEWVLSSCGHGRIVARDGTKVIVDLGRHGLPGVRLFREFLQRVHPSDIERQCNDLPRWHTRWRWFVLNPRACGGREICPCCGLPGVEAVWRPCHLCGWIHDGGDFNPQRMSRIHHDLNLDLARSRFDALGYAAVIRGPAAEDSASRSLRTRIRRKRLVDALDGLVGGATGRSGQPPAEVEALWTDYEASLQPVSTRAE